MNVWSVFRRNVAVLWHDVSFNRSVKMLGVVVCSALLIFVALWFLGIGIRAEVYQGGAGRHPISFAEYLFCVLGAIDAMPETAPVYAVYSAVVRLLGAVMIGGFVTSFLCTLLGRYSDMTLKGLLYHNLSGHTIVIGYGMITDDLIRRVLSGEDFESWYKDRPFSSIWNKGGSPRGRDRVLLYTGGDIEKIREQMNHLLPPCLASRIDYYAGQMDVSGLNADADNEPEIVRQLCLGSARRIFILGDDEDPGAGDLRNINFARMVDRCV